MTDAYPPKADILILRTRTNLLSIRNIRQDELMICAYILTISWNNTFPKKIRTITSEEFTGKTRDELILVAEFDHEIVGFISLYEPGCFIHHLFVIPNHQRKGIGKALLLNIIQRAETSNLSLKCNIENEAAIAFYDKFGFIKTEENGEDETGPWVKLQQTKF